jgi:two-component system NtrC family sensor kinase
VLAILANQTAIAIENNIYIEETKNLIKKVTEAEVQKKYVEELEEKNQSLQKLYRTLQETQSQLIQSEKMASLGQLVAGVAHELNNPISFIYANMKELENYINAIEEILKLLLSNINKSDLQEKIRSTVSRLEEKYDLEFIQKDIHSLITESVEGGRRVKEVVQNLRNFSRLDEGDVKPVDIHEGLNSTLLLLNNEIKNRIEIIKNYGELPKVECHPGHINQIFMNILLNSIQAIEAEGKIWISTKTANEQVEIIIKDSGKGIPQNIKEKIFDPFFTTKPVGKGTGLGLNICYNIIKNHHGEIYAESEEGKGTTFHIKLPVKMKKGKNG